MFLRVLPLFLLLVSSEAYLLVGRGVADDVETRKQVCHVFRTDNYYEPFESSRSWRQETYLLNVEEARLIALVIILSTN
ncbi:hypothetical protein CAEBREN_21055 [Caenorhabditis brenneri]|uniref:Uncharacterized protein n=1 Tax=Caenorhabditis brenneri TaxID=135651 RepID=G0P406_CAEBE|nr:hypothetical protein CAEBREN_21055 [Caenorhabditis brenneri]